MRIGIPKEIKNNENRVAITPSGVGTLLHAGHEVFIENGAGEGAGFTDASYRQAGARLCEDPAVVWAQEMVMKVKEPLPEEYGYFYEGLILFTYLHLAAEPELTQALLKKKVTSIAYETIQKKDGSLPLLAPMSEVAGRIATQKGAQILEKTNGGRGILLSGIPGVKPGKVTVIGGGIVGTNAAKIALGLGAEVTIVDLNVNRLRELDDQFGNQVKTVMSSPLAVRECLQETDLLIGAVLIPGTKAPKLVTEDMVKSMKEKSVIIDVAIDQGGIVETCDRISTHDDPTYEKHGVIHYAVANMPGAVPRTSSLGLTNVTLPYALKLANKGVQASSLEDPALMKGLNTYSGSITCKAVADSLGLTASEAQSLVTEDFQTYELGGIS